MPEGWRNPSEHGMAYEDVWLMTPDKKQISGWLIKVAGDFENAKTILFFHGNAGNIGARLPNLKVLVKKMNCNVFIIDYRGYGSSEGKPTEAGLKIDAQASLDYLRKRTDINQEMIFVFGRSLGGAVAIELCMQPNSGIRGLILENTFTSISDMASTMVPVPYSTIFKWFLQKIHYPSIKRIRKVKQPILFIRGMQDEIVPVKFM